MYRFLQKAKEISYSYRNRPMSPLNLSIWWIEHIVATGGLNLAKSNATELSWFVYHSIDIILVLLVFLLFLSTIIFILIKQCCHVIHCIRNAKTNKKKKKN